MKNLNMKRATERYNAIVCGLCYEHVSIGTNLSEGTENWNLRDMVAELDYILSTYYEYGHANYELKEENYKQWLSETGKIQRFIYAYEPFVKDMVCNSGHCSSFDN